MPVVFESVGRLDQQFRYIGIKLVFQRTGLAARRLPPRVRLVPPAEPVTRRVFTVSRRGGDRKPAVRVVLDALSAAAA